MKLKASKVAISNNMSHMNSSMAEMTKRLEERFQAEASKDKAILQAQKEKYLDYIKNKLTTWNSDFLISMRDKLEQGQTLTENMTAALDKCITKDAEFEAKKSAPKSETPTKRITCKMRQWWIRENKIDSRIITGDILAETAKAYRVKGHADMVEGTWCMRCGRELTEPASMVIGYGAECCEKLGIPYPADILGMGKKELMAIRKQLLKVLHNQEFEAWIPKSQIETVIEIVDIKPDKAPAKARASKKI